MFEKRARFQSNEEYRRLRAGKQGATLAQWQREAETWFDGSVESVDRRLAMCERLLGGAQEKIAHTGLSADHGNALALIGALERNKVAMKELRHDILTGSTWREEAPRRSDPRLERRLLASLSSEDRRYVELTSEKIVSADRETDPDELAARSRYQAARDTSAYHDVRSDRIVDAVALRVAQRARQRPRVRIASRPAEIPNFPAELMFL